MLNYHHLRLFHAVAREGHLSRAAKGLGLTPQTVSTQIRQFEEDVGEKLFDRVGRRLVLTEAGQVALQYAEEIFALGTELQHTLRGQLTGRAQKLVVGVIDAMPKHIVHHLVEPALHMSEPVHVEIREDSHNALLGALATHEIDVVLTDSPIPPRSGVKAYNHPLGECGVTFMAVATLASVLRPGFPRSLDRAPVLLPTRESVMRRDLDHWFERNDVQPEIIGEFQDSALLKIFGQNGEGFFAVPTVVAEEVARQYQVAVIGKTNEVQERFFALSVERRIHHPAVAAICDSARLEFFA